MANIKPIDLKQGKISKEEIEARKQAEDSMKGTLISDKVPTRLSVNGKKIYKHLLGAFPRGFLTETDSYTLEIVANAIDVMQVAQQDVKSRGIYLEDGTPNPSHLIYERYTKIFNQMASKLGLSPKDRSQLAMLLVNQQVEDSDPLLSILKG